MNTGKKLQIILERVASELTGKPADLAISFRDQYAIKGTLSEKQIASLRGLILQIRRNRDAVKDFEREIGEVFADAKQCGIYPLKRVI